MNKVLMIGRLTADAEMKNTGDITIARCTVAVDRRFNKSEQTADFISCVSFGKKAEFLEKYGRKGTKFAIEGRIQTGSYTNRDGNKVYTTEVVIEEIEFAERKKDGTATQPKQDDGFISIPDGLEEELPFV